MEIILQGRSSSEISALIAELRAMDLLPGRDFDFWYVPASYDWSALEHRAGHTRFQFYNLSAGTWFALRWS